MLAGEPEPEETPPETPAAATAEGESSPPASPSETTPSSPPQQEAEPQEKRTVPLAVLTQERAEWKDRLERETQERLKLNGRLDVISQMLAKRDEKPAPPKPSVEEQPIEAIKVLERKVENYEQQTQRTQAIAQLVNHAAELTRQFAQKTPDYRDAYQFARESRFRELVAIGRSEAEAMQVLADDEMQLGYSALQSGRNPGELVYAFAKARGYTPKAAAAGAAPAQDRLETVERGQTAARSLGTMGGTATAKLSVESLAAMSDADFARATADPEAFRRLFE